MMKKSIYVLAITAVSLSIVYASDNFEKLPAASKSGKIQPISAENTAKAPQEEKKHPIDIAQEACMDKDWTTQGMLQCSSKALKEWEKEMNKNYKKLMGELKDKEDKAGLKASQDAWVAYDKANINFSGAMYYKQQGTMWRVIAAQNRVDTTKARTLELGRYYDNIFGSWE